MAAKTNYLEAALLNHILRTTAFTQPTNVYVALFTVAPTDAYTSGSPTGTEVTGGSYARVSIARADAQWAAPSGTPRVTSNANAVTFPTATADWGTVVAWGLFDAATTGNLLIWGAVSPNRSCPNGSTPSFAAGQLTYQED